MSHKTSIEFDHYFSAAHHLPDSDGLTTKKCLQLHGHTYGVRVFLTTDTLHDNFVVDFGTIKSTIDNLDHATIVHKDDTALLTYLTDNNLDHYVMDVPSTAENISHEIYNMLNDAIHAVVTVTEVWIAEGVQPGKTNWVKYAEVAE